MEVDHFTGSETANNFECLFTRAANRDAQWPEREYDSWHPGIEERNCIPLLRGVSGRGSLHQNQVAAQRAQFGLSLFGQSGIADYSIDLGKRCNAGHAAFGELAGVSYENDLA
jgi:hypothetical protein